MHRGQRYRDARSTQRHTKGYIFQRRNRHEIPEATSNQVDVTEETMDGSHIDDPHDSCENKDFEFLFENLNF